MAGRIDANSSEGFEKELMSSCTPGEDVCLNADGLEYISSAGLRVLLKLKKSIQAEVRVINASNDVYDIFEVTGFSEILTVEKKLRELTVDENNVIGEGANGKVYRLDDETIIKVFAPGVPMNVVKEERDIARAAFVSGVPTAISYDIARVGESYGAVYEMLNAKTLSAVINENKDRAVEMGCRLGKLLKELHRTLANKEKLTDMLEVYKDRAHKMEKYLSDTELDKLISVYNALDSRSTMLHGDFHPKNVMYMDDELIFIDMGDVGYGHPLLDIGGSYLPMMHIGKFKPDLVFKYIGMDFDTATRVWDSMLLEYFGEEHLEEGKILAEIYGEAKYMLMPFIYTKMTDEIAVNLIARTRQNGFLSDSFDITPVLTSNFL